MALKSTALWSAPWLRLGRSLVNSSKAESSELVTSILEETWAFLRVEEKARTSKALLADRILEAALTGERDPVRLRAKALTGIVLSL